MLAQINVTSSFAHRLRPFPKPDLKSRELFMSTPMADWPTMAD